MWFCEECDTSCYTQVTAHVTIAAFYDVAVVTAFVMIHAVIIAKINA